MTTTPAPQGATTRIPIGDTVTIVATLRLELVAMNENTTAPTTDDLLRHLRTGLDLPEQWVTRGSIDAGFALDKVVDVQLA